MAKKIVKKAEGLPINIIIIAAMGLAVLVVFFITFTSEASNFSKAVLTCEAKGGQCIDTKECVYQKTTFSCPKKEQVCCINTLGR